MLIEFIKGMPLKNWDKHYETVTSANIFDKLQTKSFLNYKS